MDSSRASLQVRCEMVSVIVLRGGGAATETLLLQRSRGRMASVWTYCGGHVEEGEHGWQAALRELLEETSLVPDAFYASTYSEQFYSAHDDVVEIVPAFVARVSAKARVRLNDEHLDHLWVTLDEAAERFPFGSQRDLLAHIRREFVEREPLGYLQVPV